ncbi:TIGR03960 family B12-binding radical SAM protein [bacterium]|nr:TIGR03960 family B12-binding radical SAM protein [bacterium]
MSKINLLNCQKPARYIPVECNPLKKDFKNASVRIALAFPDTYEIGMSNTGYNIIYHVINQHEDFSAERVFAPWTDYESELKKTGEKLSTLETGTCLNEFDFIGFSIHYELSYTNILKILNLGGIPFYARERNDDFPILICGGSGIYNPEPIAEFFDLFFLGDGDEGIIELLGKFKELKERNSGKKEILLELSKLDGVYVPSFYDVMYHDDGRISEIARKESLAPLKIRKRILKDLDSGFEISAPIIPALNIVHNRLSLEVSRGCIKGCRFCQAGIVGRPVRERSLDKIMKILQSGLDNTGYEEISLLSLNITEYSNLDKIITGFFSRYGESKVSLSLPSLHPEQFKEFIPESIKQSKKTGLTLVMEAATERLRNVINKNISGKMVIESVITAVRAGWQHIKIYFMIGLPTETHEDIKALVSFVEELYKECRKTSKKFKSLRISISSFCPKPNTPFQWVAQNSIHDLREKMDFIKNSLKKFRGIGFSFNMPEMSFIEAVFARGDRRLGKVILEAYKKGCSFDAWTEQFKFALWLKAFEENGIDPNFYASRERMPDEILPWDLIDVKVKKEFLLDEYERAMKGEPTLDCQTEHCHLCGVCDRTIKNVIKKLEGSFALGSSEVSSKADPPSIFHELSRELFYYRGEITKYGKFRFISHLDFIRLITRAFRRTKLPFAYTEGFSPKMKLSTGTALPVGMESDGEYLDFALTEDIPEGDVLDKINEYLPGEVHFNEISRQLKKPPSIDSSVREIEYELTLPMNVF